MGTERDVWLLGPQRFNPCVAEVVRDLGVDGPIATLTAGWQEREPDDEELDAMLDGRSTNLGLYGRWLDIRQRDPELAEAVRERRASAEEQQAVYLLRLDHAVDALRALQQRAGDPGIAEAAIDDAIEVVRALDRWHLERLTFINDMYREAWRPHERPVVAEHQAQVAEILGGSGALAIAGGRVDILDWTLQLFDIGQMLGDIPIVAWSAGAMVLTETIVLFHDRPVHGHRYAEVLDRGLGLVSDVVALPHARRRLDLDDRRRAELLARRFEPAHCLILDDGERIRFPGGRWPADAGPVVAADGTVQPSAA